MRIILIPLAVLSLSACATAGETGRYSSDYERLNAECEARNGILVPTAGPPTGQASTEYVCEIRDIGRLPSD